MAVDKVLAFVELELRRLRHDPTEVFTRAVQPALWIGVFGTVMSRVRAIPTGSVDYLTFIAPGVLMQSTSFIAIAYGIMLVWERDSGILKRVLTLPVNRFLIVLGRSLSGATRALSQLFVVLLIALPLGARLNVNPLALCLAALAVYVCSTGLTALSIIMASAMKTRERFMGIIQAITMPLFFTSNALYPVEFMPQPLQYVSLFNPLTYTIQALRASLIYCDYWSTLANTGILAAFSLAMLLAATAALPRIIE